MAKIGQKNYTIQVFDKTYSTLQTIIADATIQGFTSVINGGFQEMTFTLERSVQDWNSAANGAFALNNVCELKVQDMDSNTPLIIFNGYISKVSITQTPDKKSVTATVLGFSTRLTKDIYRNGTTTTITHSSADPSTIFKAIVDKLRDTANGNIPFLNYISTGTQSVATTGLSVSYAFRSMTFFDAIEQCRKMSPAFWYWYIGTDKNFYFQSKPTAPTHKLFLGQIDTFQADYSLEDIVNAVLIWDGSTNYRYLADAASIAAYGRRLDLVQDSNNTGTDGMDKTALQEIGEKKDPRSTIQIKVADNNEWEDINSNVGYDIESFRVGQTVSISGISETAASGLLSPNMTIVRIQYYPTYAILDLELPAMELSDYLAATKKSDDKAKKTTIPSTYTAV